MKERGNDKAEPSSISRRLVFSVAVVLWITNSSIKYKEDPRVILEPVTISAEQPVSESVKNILRLIEIQELKDKDELIYKTVNFDVNLLDIRQSIAVRHRNPGNLRPVGRRGYRRFMSLEDGYNALIDDLTMKINGQSRYTDSTTTIAEFVSIYAPPFENNTSKYIKMVCEAMNVEPDYKLRNIVQVHRLAKIIIKAEDRKLYKAMYND